MIKYNEKNGTIKTKIFVNRGLILHEEDLIWIAIIIRKIKYKIESCESNCLLLVLELIG